MKLNLSMTHFDCKNRKIDKHKALQVIIFEIAFMTHLVATKQMQFEFVTCSSLFYDCNFSQ